MSLSAISSATSGMRVASARLETSAANLARASPTAGIDLASEIVDSIDARTQFQASTAIARVAGQMQKSAIDILA